MTQHIGPEELLVAAKLDFRRELTVAQLSDAIDAAEARVRAVVPLQTRLYLEPALVRELAHAPSAGSRG